MTRKHRGIIQEGFNKGRLLKGYKYTGKKTLTGLPIIKKIKQKQIGGNYSNNVLFTCTTFISKEKKLEELCKALDTFIKFNSYISDKIIGEYIIINEYGENTEEKIKILKKKYPKFHFINKKKSNKGQARSVNLIIQYLKKNKDKFKYWLHWEESWFSTGPILEKAYNIMVNSNISQLQLIYRWFDVIHANDILTIEHEDYVEFKASKRLQKAWNKLPNGSIWKWDKSLKRSIKKGTLWPFYSLSPGIDRVDQVLNTGYFNEDPNKWPVQFEYEWALKWVKKNKIIKAVIKNSPIIRSKEHKSTYSNNNLKKQNMII